MRAAKSLRRASGAQNQELRERIRELEDALRAIRTGQVDAFLVPGGVATSNTARAAAERLRQGTLDDLRDAVLAFDDAGHVLYMNPAAERQYGWASEDALGRPRAAIYEERPDVASSDAAPSCAALIHRLRSGRSIHVESTVSPLLDGAGLVFGTVALVRDVTERRRAEHRRDALAKLGERLREAEDTQQAGSAAEHALGTGLHASGAACLWFDPATFAGGGWQRQDAVPIPLAAIKGAARLARLEAGESASAQASREDASGALLTASIRTPGCMTAVLAAWNWDHSLRWTPAEVEFGRDVADRTRAAFERIEAAAALRDSEARLRHANEHLESAIRQRTNQLMVAEEALRQAQKMEAIGQLTGGIAHDFNNLLASISGSLQVLRVKLGRGETAGFERYIDMGLEAVKRAAALTQRLLAFARRQTLDSKPTNVNRLIAGMEDLLRRTVGAAVVVEVVGSASLWITKVDPPQLENALLNLCINARDAMTPAGGRLTIKTENMRVDGSTEAEHGLAPGEYVVLSVADTGVGMAPEMMDRIFDPFFTTKPLGQGTGLGLSMVYGFVRQTGGQVRVSSEVGAGTTMCLYLPRYEGEAAEVEVATMTPAPEGGRGETVLVIEDQESIRSLLAEVLESGGYHVLTAADGPGGLQILKRHARIDLLITDVGLPGGLNGRQVADAARIHRPRLKVLFVTGYADNAGVGNGQLDSGMELLTKPFDLETLTRRVRDMIG